MDNMSDHICLPAGWPEGFLNKMRELLGEEFGAFVESCQRERVQGLRFNTLKGDLADMAEENRERFGLRPVPWCREGFYYEADSRPGRHPYHAAGVYYIQEPSAMAVVSLLDPKPGERVLDLCAAPGGKATHLAERLAGQGLLVANEIHPARAKILSQNIERMGVANAIVTNEDPARLAERFPEFFHRIVVDAPCSGEGMFRKDEQARQEWSEANVDLCARRQQEILDSAARMLMPGGRLVYSTCTFSPEEDEQTIAGFLRRHPEFSVVEMAGDFGETEPVGLSLGKSMEIEGNSGETEPVGLSFGKSEWMGLRSGRPEWAGEETDPRILEQIGYTFRIWPHLAEGEGHYLALLEKEGEAKKTRETERVGAKGKKNSGLERERLRQLGEMLREVLSEDPSSKESFPVTPSTSDSVSTMLSLLSSDIVSLSAFGSSEFQAGNRITWFGDQIYWLPEGISPSMLDGLRVLRPGLHLGTVKKNRLEPSHALALALRPSQARQCISLSADGYEVSAYLNGQTLTAEPGQKGWVLVCVDSYSLGWGKAAAGILKNHYPRGLRIPQS